MRTLCPCSVTVKEKRLNCKPLDTAQREVLHLMKNQIFSRVELLTKLTRQHDLITCKVRTVISSTTKKSAAIGPTQLQNSQATDLLCHRTAARATAEEAVTLVPLAEFHEQVSHHPESEQSFGVRNVLNGLTHKHITTSGKPFCTVFPFKISWHFRAHLGLPSLPPTIAINLSALCF